ncbi:MAG: MCE family protein [Frankiales bacterium]|nr:MCE family protein [Frankiales bacterium]
MSAPKTAGLAAAVKRRVLGLGFLAVIAGAVALSIALYNKAFTPVVEVTLKAGSAGNQLSAPADVKLRGLIVGEVRTISSTGDGATLELALDPDQVALIPANVQAQLVPKTLFGEKFVDLVIPDKPSQTPIRAGAVIGQDRSVTARETEQALNDLLPLLTALRPQDVSTALNGISSALRGRGDRLGKNLVLVDGYLKGINPELPTLRQNFDGLADFSDTLNRTTPNLSAVLDNTSFLARSLVDTKGSLSRFLASTTTSTQDLDRLLTNNENRLVRLAADSLPSLQVYDKYSPEFPCLAKGLAASDTFISNSFGGLQPGLHITLEFVKEQGGYTPNADEPRYRDDRGPRCYGIPDPKGRAADINFKDGFRDNGGPDTTQAGAASSPAGNAGSEPARALAGSTAERRVMGAVLAPVLGVSGDDVPDLAYLLFGPMARGTQVGLK